ncbi:MAG TPA: NIPSNAP family protein [Draconibacterium sp.]|nr:NIPSNAP family protein [Draconibacterium sp.]HRX12734.1 NIPSNAP family protein [Draconibacterium sp.]
MKSTKKSVSGLLSILVFFLVFMISSTLSARDYYQLKVYTIKNSDQEKSIDNYLKTAYIPAMHRAGVKTVGVFKPKADDPAVGTKIFVLVPLKEMAQIEKIETDLSKDKEYQTNAADYINAAFDNPPYERIESILLKAFAKQPDLFVPKFTTPRNEQIFELRSYQSATEKIYHKKVEMFNEGGETEIFKNIGANAVFYGEVISGSQMPNLMYMTSYENMQSNEDHWKLFRDHPDWKKLSGMEEYKNTVSHIDKWMCNPTDYSDI